MTSPSSSKDETRETFSYDYAFTGEKLQLNNGDQNLGGRCGSGVLVGGRGCLRSSRWWSVQGGVGGQAVCKCDQAELQGGSQGDPWSQRPLQGGHHHQGGQHHHHGVDKPPFSKLQ